MCLWNTNALGGNRDHTGYSKYKGHSQGHKFINPVVSGKGFISWVCMQSMKCQFLKVQKLWPRINI